MKGLITIFSLLIAPMLFAQTEVPSIECVALRGQLKVYIVDQQLQITNQSDRSPASVPTLINRLRSNTLIQVTYLQGQRHRLFIENIFNLANSSNTVSVRSVKGHEMTYPLDCRHI